MTSRWRWLVVAAGVLVLGVTPYVVSRLPSARTGISAASLLSRIERSARIPYTGYAEAHGGLALPATDDFSDLADLLGATTDLRIWWRSSARWRVDQLTVTGETDVYNAPAGVWTWNFERNRAIFQPAEPVVRLPRAADLAPASLARRLLTGARPGEVSRLPDRRIAGHDSAGLRLVPDEDDSTISRVDVWALPSGLPVAVAAYGNSSDPFMSTTMLDVSTSPPSIARTMFDPSSTAREEYEDATDVVSALDRFVTVTPPSRLAGLARTPVRTSLPGSVGVYGRAVAGLVAVPLPPRLADSVAEQLSGTTSTAGGAVTLDVGPLTLRVTARGADGSRWLLAGTVTQDTLARAEVQLPPVAEFRR